MKLPTRRSNTRPRWRWFVIGLILGMIIALQLWINSHNRNTTPPIVERQVVGSTTRQVSSTVPEIGFILQRRRHLGLSDQQVQKLEKLQAGWQTESTPINADLKKAADNFDSFMKQTKGKASMQNIQSHTAAVTALSAKISNLRIAYWEKGLNVLTIKQTKTICDEATKKAVPVPLD